VINAKPRDTHPSTGHIPSGNFIRASNHQSDQFRQLPPLYRPFSPQQHYQHVIDSLRRSGCPSRSSSRTNCLYFWRQDLRSTHKLCKHQATSRSLRSRRYLRQRTCTSQHRNQNFLNFSDHQSLTHNSTPPQPRTQPWTTPPKHSRTSPRSSRTTPAFNRSSKPHPSPPRTKPPSPLNSRSAPQSATKPPPRQSRTSSAHSPRTTAFPY